MNKIISKLKNMRGGAGSYFLLWLIGVPLPILLLISLIRGCN